MLRLVKMAAAGALLTAAASIAGAAPSSAPTGPLGLSNGIIKVHGDHASCQRDRRGWHRHNRWGERRPCREWRGEGRRPDSCVRVGPIWMCDY